MSGVVVDERGEVVVGATVSAQSAKGVRTAITGGQGAFSMRVPAGPVPLRVTGKDIVPFRWRLRAMPRQRSCACRPSRCLPRSGRRS